MEVTEDNRIVIPNAKALIQEAKALLHKSGPKTYMQKFLEGKTRLHKKHGWFPEEKRIEVATLFAAGVINSQELAKLTGINDNTIRAWKTKDWWTDLLERIHVAHDQETVSKFTKIVDKSLEVIEDRLDAGDYVITKKGEVKRKPVSMRDAASVASTVVDKRQLLRGKPTSRSETISTDKRLENLAKEFAKFSKARDITPEVEVVNDSQSPQGV